MEKGIIREWEINDKFSRNLLEHGSKYFMQGIYLRYVYSIWRKIRGLDKEDPKENKGQLQSSFREFENKIKKD